jgi:hypothetical protein
LGLPVYNLSTKEDGIMRTAVADNRRHRAKEKVRATHGAKLRRSDALELILTDLVEAAEAACRAHWSTVPDSLRSFTPTVNAKLSNLHVRCQHVREALKSEGLAKYDAAGAPTRDSEE